MGRPETRFPCRAHNRLQAIAVTLARCMHLETPATPQTVALLNPFSVQHKRRRHMGNAESQKQLQNQKQRHHDLVQIFLSTIGQSPNQSAFQLTLPNTAKDAHEQARLRQRILLLARRSLQPMSQVTSVAYCLCLPPEPVHLPALHHA